MGLIEWIGAILGGIAINLVASELFAWGPRFSEWLTHWAVRRLPVEMQERMQEEWAGHLNALHPLSRSFAAIGFVLAANRIKVSFDRDAKGALTLREWLAPKPIFVVVMTEKGAMSMARKMSEAINLEDDRSSAVDLGPVDAEIRLNLMAKAKTALRHVQKRMLRIYGKELQPKHIYCTNLSRTSSGDLAIKSARETWLFRIRSTIRR
jgi:hypothetical protein